MDFEDYEPRFIKVTKLSSLTIQLRNISVSGRPVMFKIHSNPPAGPNYPISGLLLPGAKTSITLGSPFSMIQVTSTIYPCDIILLPSFNNFWTIVEECEIDKEYFCLEKKPVDLNFIDDDEDDFNMDNNNLLDQVQIVLDAAIAYYQRSINFNVEDIETIINNAKFEAIITLTIIFAAFSIFHLLFNMMLH